MGRWRAGVWCGGVVVGGVCDTGWCMQEEGVCGRWAMVVEGCSGVGTQQGAVWVVFTHTAVVQVEVYEYSRQCRYAGRAVR